MYSHLSRIFCIICIIYVMFKQTVYVLLSYCVQCNAKSLSDYLMIIYRNGIKYVYRLVFELIAYFRSYYYLICNLTKLIGYE